MKRAFGVAVLVAASGVAIDAVDVSATPATGVTTTILAKSTYDALKINAHAIPGWRAKVRTRGLSDVYVVDNKFAPATATAPGGTTGWHSHPGPSLIQVVAGSVTNYMGGDPTATYTGGHPKCTGHTYGPGEGFVDAGGDDVHLLRNEGAVPAETIAVQLLPKDAVRRTEKPEPSGCHL